MQEIYQDWVYKNEETQKIVSVKRVKSKQNEADKPEPIIVKLDECFEINSVELQDGRHVRKMKC
jgi:hypothetical protein